MGTKAEVDLCLAVKEAGYGMDMSKFSKGAVFEIEEMQQKRARQDTIRNK